MLRFIFEYVHIDNSFEMKYQFSAISATAVKTQLIEFVFIFLILNVDISSHNPISSNSSFVHTYVRAFCNSFRRNVAIITQPNGI